MVALGAFVKVRPIIRMDSLIRALEKALPVRRKQMLSLDEDAIRRGGESVVERGAIRNG
jgi:2-oxoglutarate ferredoxin oxidoreductase subunit gamma